MKKSRNRLKFFVLISIIWLLIGLIFALIAYFSAQIENSTVSVKTLFIIHLVRFYTWGVLIFPIFLCVRRLNFSKNKYWVRNLLVLVLIGAVSALLHTALYTLLTWTLNAEYQQRFPDIFIYLSKNVFFYNIYLGILFYSLIIISINAFLFYQNFQTEAAKSSRLEAQLAQSQLKALKMQIHPHFLFNTLHSISFLVMENPLQANRMIAQLGDFLRLAIETSDEQMVLLDRELAFLSSYLEIEQIRFQDRLTVEFNIDRETLRAEVPHLILQPIVENAIKHGISPHSKPGKITICAKVIKQKLQLKITDNGLGITDGSICNNGTGLINVRSRLEQIYGECFQFEAKNEKEIGFSVTFELPFEIQTNNHIAAEKVND